MKTNTVLTLGALALTMSAASAASIAVNFADNTNQIFTGGELIGPTAISSSNWNNTADTTPAANGSYAAGTVIDDSGATVAAATITWSSNNMWYNGAGTGSDNNKLQTAYLDDGGAGPSISLTGHGYTTYDLYVMVSGDQGADSTFLHDSITVNGVASGAFDALGYNASGVWTAADGTVGGTAGNYIVFSGLTGDLSMSTVRDAGRAPIGGFVVVDTTAVPEPSSAALLGLGGLSLILRRRK